MATPLPVLESTPGSPSLTDTVRAHDRQAATMAASGQRASCCGPVAHPTAGSCCGGATPSWSAVAAALDPFSDNLDDASQTAALPSGGVLASLGCGNPTSLSELHPGEVVLDLGSGGGIDVWLAARRVGPTGKAYGLDMTDPMLELARRNQAASGLTNVEFLRGEVPDAVRRSMSAWVGCIAGAIDEQAFIRLLQDIGFGDVSVEPTREYTTEDAKAFMTQVGMPDAATLRAVEGRFISGFVRATKPGTSSVA